MRMDEDEETGTAERARMLPVVVADASAAGSPLVRVRPGAAFVAQLLAAREGLAPRRGLRRAREDAAAGAYRAADGMDVKRLPPGYRRTLTA